MDKIQICKTKYPIMLVHGIGFRNSKSIGYWGRIPQALESQGATVFCSKQDGWGTIETNGSYLTDEIDQILAETGSERINLIAHSKGGIDSRYLLSLPEPNRIASITTISTPHHGSKSMDFLMHVPAFLVKFAGIFVGVVSRLLGDKNPNFYQTCMQMTTKRMAEFNDKHNNTSGVYCQSFGALMRKPSSDIIMMIQNAIVSLIEGENDGLVTPSSASWENYTGVIIGSGKRGVSHADVVDLRRRPFVSDGNTPHNSKVVNPFPENDSHFENLPAPLLFVDDITDIYVAIVEDLKKRNY